MDMTALIHDTTIDPCAFAESLIQNFAQDVEDRLRRLS
jgi:hypothetical protein